MKIETWFDDNFKYEVQLIDRVENKQNDKVDSFVLIYKVIKQTKRESIKRL